jgi:hypothetical protein
MTQRRGFRDPLRIFVRKSYLRNLLLVRGLVWNDDWQAGSLNCFFGDIGEFRILKVLLRYTSFGLLCDGFDINLKCCAGNMDAEQKKAIF